MAYSLKYSYDSSSRSYSVIGYSNITTSDKVVIPSTYDDGTNGEHPVTSLVAYAFQNCRNLTSVTIGNSVTSIGNYAFADCSSLTSVTIPDSVTSIGKYAFQNCSSLTSITIGNSVTSINDYAFRNCSSLTSITIPESVTSIGYYAFQNCRNLTSVTIPNSVTSIGENAFQNCHHLTSVTIPNSVTSIKASAFSGCSNLTSMMIPNSVTSIEGYTFESCSSLTSVTIGNSVTSIGAYAFAECSSLTSIAIPDSVTSIGAYAFKYCNSLTSIAIPDSVTSINDYAFRTCFNLTSVTIGNSVTNIGSYTFQNCSSLKQLILFPLTPPTLGSDAIPSTISKIYVQQSSKVAYQAATNWTAFASKIVSDNIYLSFVRFNQKNKEYIDKKLTSPATPTADSAVTMLSDGTVGTKPLSDLLTLKEPNYVLIEKVITGYTVLETAPEDFTTNYASYYKTNGKARNDIDFNYVALTEAETFETGKYYSKTTEGTVLNRYGASGKEPDGTSYAFKNMYFYFENLQTAWATYTPIHFYNGNSLFPYHFYLSRNNSANQAEVYANIYGNMMTAISTKLNSEMHANSDISIMRATIKDNMVLSGFSVGKLPADTTVLIYGVRV